MEGSWDLQGSPSQNGPSITVFLAKLAPSLKCNGTRDFTYLVYQISCKQREFCQPWTMWLGLPWEWHDQYVYGLVKIQAHWSVSSSLHLRSRLHLDNGQIYHIQCIFSFHSRTEGKSRVIYVAPLPKDFDRVSFGSNFDHCCYFGVDFELVVFLFGNIMYRFSLIHGL